MKNDKHEELEKEFIDEFINIRRKKKLSQREFAEYSGVGRVQIAKIENRIASPCLKSLIKILEPLGYTVKIKKIYTKNSK